MMRNFSVWCAISVAGYLCLMVESKAKNPSTSKAGESGLQEKSDLSLLDGVDTEFLWAKLRSKRRKLKRLQAEIQTLRAFLTKSGNFQQSDSSPEIDTGTWIKTEEETFDHKRRGLKNKKRKKNKKKKRNWKRQLLKELRRLNIRLKSFSSPESKEALETVSTPKIQNERPILSGNGNKGISKKEKRNKRREERRKLRKEKKTRRQERQKEVVEIIPPDPEAFRKQKRTEITSARHSAQRGGVGMSCSFHADCRPGRCCHNRSVNGTVCADHGLETGAVCADSCQCSSGLHCYQSKEEKAQKLLNGRCQVATAEDIIKGIYLNSKHSLFTD